MPTGEAPRPQTDRSRSRRAVLTSLGAASVALAGCSSDDSNPDSGGSDGGATAPETSAQATGTGDESVSGCPSPPFSYTTYSVSGGDEFPPFSIDAPDIGETERLQDIAVSYSFPNDDGATMVNASSAADERGVDEAVDGRQGFTETTEQYDLAVSGARVLTPNPDEIGITLVLLPADSGTTVVNVNFTIAPRYDCNEAVQAVHQRMVESVSGPR